MTIKLIVHNRIHKRLALALAKGAQVSLIPREERKGRRSPPTCREENRGRLTYFACFGHYSTYSSRHLERHTPVWENFLARMSFAPDYCRL